MKTQLQAARDGLITPTMQAAADREQIPAAQVRDRIAAGRAVLPANPAHLHLNPAVIGRAFRTKINANLGVSPAQSCLESELAKLRLSLKLGADCVMDLSVGPDVHAIRQAFLDASTAPMGTVPVYEALARVDGDAMRLSAEGLLAVIREQAEQGVDFMTLHAGLLRRHLAKALNRRMGIVSRGGAILGRWMQQFDLENPLYTAWEDVMDICRRHDVTVSLGDGLRPGCLSDAGDAAQYAELEVLGELVTRCREAGVQVMVEGPGHVPLDQIEAQLKHQRELCDDAPFYVLGPLVTDIAAGYDHIASAIGATVAAWHGAALLCYVTPAEHLCLPDLEDVRQGVVAYKLAAHAGDVARRHPGAIERDNAMSNARRTFDWNRQFELALDGESARRRFEQGRAPGSTSSDFCSMCGEAFCAIRNTRELEKSRDAVPAG